jgi:hypothetical protein
MKRNNYLVWLFASMISVVFMAAESLPATDNLPQKLKEAILVEAEVTAVQPGKYKVKGTLKIKHVFCGSMELLGKTFVIDSSKSPQDFTGFNIYPPLKQSERGIWLLKQREDGTLIRVERWRWGVRWPVREKITPRYKQAEILAKMLERVYRAKTDERVEILRKSALSKVPEVSMAAVQLLGEMKSDETRAILRNLLKDTTLPASGLVMLDSVLEAIDLDWSSSTKRLEVLRKLVNSRVSSYEAERILDRISQSWQHKKTTDEVARNLSKLAAFNTSFPLTARQNALRFLGWMAAQASRNKIKSSEKISSASFDILIDAMEKLKETKLRVSAALTLGIIPFDPDRLKRMKAIRDREKCPEVKKALEATINRCEQHKRKRKKDKLTAEEPNCRVRVGTPVGKGPADGCDRRNAAAGLAVVDRAPLSATQTEPPAIPEEIEIAWVPIRVFVMLRQAPTLPATIQTLKNHEDILGLHTVFCSADARRLPVYQ